MNDRIETVIAEAACTVLVPHGQCDEWTDEEAGRYTREMSTAIFAALKAARIAVVELPEPLPPRVEGEFPAWKPLAGIAVLADIVFDEVLMSGSTFNPAEAWGIAAALLAAADAVVEAQP